ncbi:MAG: thermonuclease family protein [Candidatus Pristimantibacillus sp.]
MITGCAQLESIKKESTGVQQVAEDSTNNFSKITNDLRLIDAKIKRVVDGDTMRVLINNQEETIRLLLVDTPETKKQGTPVQPFGPEASDYAKEILITGKSVKLEIDVSESDKYSRLLVYLWVDDILFNELLLVKGLARVAYVYPPNVKYVEQFRALQKQSQESSIGIWSIENYVQEDGGFN